MTRTTDLLLRGAGGEPIDFLRTIASHGVAELPPNELSLEDRTLVTTLPVGSGTRTVRLTSAGRKLRLDVVAGNAGARVRDTLGAILAHMFRLDEDLSGFYAIVVEDGELDWCAGGAGRMLRAPTVFEDVVLTGCLSDFCRDGASVASVLQRSFRQMRLRVCGAHRVDAVLVAGFAR